MHFKNTLKYLHVYKQHIFIALFKQKYGKQWLNYWFKDHTSTGKLMV